MFALQEIIVLEKEIFHFQEDKKLHMCTSLLLQYSKLINAAKAMRVVY